MQTMLLYSGLFISLALALAAALALALFVRLTSGAHGLRARVGRLFRLPDRARPLSTRHYYQPYWRAR
jgi:hypothetical protein